MGGSVLGTEDFLTGETGNNGWEEGIAFSSVSESREASRGLRVACTPRYLALRVGRGTEYTLTF